MNTFPFLQSISRLVSAANKRQLSGKPLHSEEFTEKRRNSLSGKVRKTGWCSKSDHERLAHRMCHPE
jgi:hypothetical protein